MPSGVPCLLGYVCGVPLCGDDVPEVVAGLTCAGMGSPAGRGGACVGAVAVVSASGGCGRYARRDGVHLRGLHCGMSAAGPLALAVMMSGGYFCSDLSYFKNQPSFFVVYF